MVTRFSFVIAALIGLSACARLGDVGQAPEFSPPQSTPEATAMMTYGISNDFVAAPPPTDEPSLWTGARGSLLGDRRALQRGDILTVVIEIDDSASISNSTDRSRSGTESMTVPNLFGLPQPHGISRYLQK